MDKFEKGQIVWHIHAIGRKFKVFSMWNPSQYYILDLESDRLLLEPTEYLLDTNSYRDHLINNLVYEN